MVGVFSKRACAELIAASAIMIPIGGLAQEDAVGLPTIEIGAAAPRDAKRSEHQDATRNDYRKKDTVTATKTDTPVIEIPQSVTTITRKQLDDQNAQSVKDALNYTAGVLSSPDTNNRYDSVFLRGFGGFGTSTRVVDFLDGLRLPRGQAFALPSIDPFLLDRIDVLKGPSAILYGQTSPGGLIAQTSRAPSAASYTEARFEGGSYLRLQSGLTSQGSLDADGNWQYSMTAIGRRSGTRYDNVDEKRVAVSPAIRWQPDADTQLTLRGFYQNDPEGGYFNSVYPKTIAPAEFRSGLGRNVNAGDSNFDGQRRTQYAVGYSFDHRFNDIVSISSKTRYSAIDLDFQSLQMAAPLTADGIVPRIALRSIEDVGGIATDNHAQFDFETGVVEHKTLAGVDFQSSTSNWAYRFGGAPALNVVTPRYGEAIGSLTPFIDNRQRLQQTGVYVQDQIALGGFRAVLGARHDWTEQDTENRLKRTTATQSSGSPSYRAALLYKFDFGLAPYGSYSTSFEPTVGVDVNNTPFKPTRGEQWEVGLKYEPAFMNAFFTFSAFDIRQENVLTPSMTPGFSNQQGEVRSRGLEFEARGNITSNLEFIGALTLLDIEITKSTVATSLGKRPQAAPGYYGSAWINYGFDTGILDGLTLGGGVRFVGSSFSNDDNSFRTDGYVVVDLAARYKFEKLSADLSGLEATLNVTNLFNEEYYSSCSSGYYCQYGNGALVLAGLRYKM